MFPIPSFLKKKKEYKHQNEILLNSTPIKIILDVDIEGKSEKITLTSSVLYVAPDDSSDFMSKLSDDFFNTNKSKDPSPSNISTAPQPPALEIEKPQQYPVTDLTQLEQLKKDNYFKGGAEESIPDVPLDTYPRLPIRDMKLPVHRLKQLKYKEIVQFFFNKDVFTKRMEQWNNDSSLMARVGSQIDSFYKELVNDKEEEIYDTPTSVQPNDSKVDVSETEETDDSEERPIYLLSKKEVDNIQIEKENIEIMLRLLLPTYHFYSEGYKTSMQYWNVSEPYMKNVLPTIQFSYIRHNGTIYTITNAVWLNDIFNVPFYRDMIRYYEKYKNWKLDIIPKLENKIKKMEKIIAKSKKTGQTLPDVTVMMKEKDIIQKVILLLEQNSMERKEYDKLFKSNNSEYSKVYKNDLSSTISNEKKNQLYFYNLIFSKENERFLSYSNHKLNDILYENNIYPLSKNNNVTDKQLLETMLENILDYAKHKGDIGYLKRNLCKTKDKTVCRPRDELSTFYYTGILYNHLNKADEPSYEIHVLVDVIEGEVNKNNLAGIKCKYENQSIGKKIELLMGKWDAWDLANRRIFLKLNSESDDVMVSKTIGEENNVSSVSDYTRDNEMRDSQKELESNLQERIRSMDKFDETQTETKFKNALNTFKENVSKFPEKNEKYMDKVKTLNWSLHDVDTEAFLNWLKNVNKYPSPSSGENNDRYTDIDRQLYFALENVEKKSDKSNYSREISRAIDEINVIQSKAQAYIENNRVKNNPRLNYINYILEFYVNFCNFLKTYWENQLQQQQQQNIGGSKGAVENDKNEFYSRIFQQMKHSHAKSLKHSPHKKRATQKNH